MQEREMNEKWEHVQTWLHYVDFEHRALQLGNGAWVVLRLSLCVDTHTAFISTAVPPQAEDVEFSGFSGETRIDWDVALDEVGVTEQWLCEQVYEDEGPNEEAAWYDELNRGYNQDRI